MGAVNHGEVLEYSIFSDFNQLFWLNFQGAAKQDVSYMLVTPGPFLHLSILLKYSYNFSIH